MRDPALQDLVRDLGAAGDLSQSKGDYLGVFSQNTNIAKSDYWLQRALASDVVLQEDGSAEVTQTISVTNTAPPYAAGRRGPETGYFTRLSESAVAVSCHAE